MATAALQMPVRHRMRRMSNLDKDVNFAGKEPYVVVPPEDVEKRDRANELASAMEIARHNLTRVDSHIDESTDIDIEPLPTRITDKYAFAFDIDGVLIRGGEAIPEAIQAMQMLNGQNTRGIKVPYIFLTNGGGKSEVERCVQLSKQLQMEVSPGQFICGHTPMREFASKYETVLVVGGEGEKCRLVAEEYGFKDVVTPGDVIKTNADTTPFRKLTEEEWNNSRVRDFTNMKIQAIFVFADSRDWAGDQQIILDFLTSKDGVLGTRSENYNEGPPVYFAHNDVLWASSHESTRIGMGALRKSVEAMFEAVTGRQIETYAFGKPQMGTFDFATRLLQQWRKETHGIDAPPETVYFVGDTPNSDIQGTNNWNQQSDSEWYSLLVKTGVWQSDKMPEFTPRAVAENVLEAVKHGMRRELRKEIDSNPSNKAELTEINDQVKKLGKPQVITRSGSGHEDDNVPEETLNGHPN